MNHAKQQRQRALADLLRSDVSASQDELVAALAGRGFTVTQATVSRDLVELGAVKSRRSGRLSYALPIDPAGSPGPRYETLLRQFAQSIDTAMNLIVIRTPPGSAHLIGVALDQTAVAGVVGNVCGDDTIFIACRSVEAAEALAATLRAA